jgi:hypothetical protein
VTEYPSPLPLSKHARVWLEAVRTAASVLALAVNVTVLVVVLAR